MDPFGSGDFLVWLFDGNMRNFFFFPPFFLFKVFYCFLFVAFIAWCRGRETLLLLVFEQIFVSKFYFNELHTLSLFFLKTCLEEV